MATLSITVPDAQLPRVLAAFGHSASTALDPIPNPIWVPATAVEIRAWILAQVKQRVLEYENGVAADADRATRTADINNW